MINLDPPKRVSSYENKCKTNLTVKEYEYVAKRKENIELLYILPNTHKSNNNY